MHSFQRWLLEVGPLAWVTASLWGKLIYFSVLLRGAWWAPAESIGQWVHSHTTVFSATLASLLLLLGLSPLLPRIWRFMLLFLLNLFLSSLILADTVHVHFYGDIISFLSFSNANALRWVIPSILEVLRPIHAVYYLDLLVGIAILPLYVRACSRTPRLNRKEVRCLCAGFLISGLLLALPAARLVWQDKNGIFTPTHLPRDASAVIGLLPYHLGDVAIHLVSSRQGIGAPELQRVRRFLQGERKKQGLSSKLFGVAHGRNVIMMSAETLQAFPIGLQIYGQLVTPRLSAFARESLYFVNFHDQTYLGTTADGEFASLQSLHPLPVGVVAAQYAENSYYGLPALLSQHGYTTLSACAAPGNFWNMNKMHSRLGFQQSFFEEQYEVSERLGPWLADREFFTQTISVLEGQTEPFMAYLLSSSNHHPFELPRKHRVLKLGELEGTLVGDYLHSVHYFDQAFGEFVDQLRETGLLDRSLLVIYGDHQAFLGDLPELARLLGFPEGSEYSHFLVRKRVPLIIRLPHGEGAGVRRVTGGHLDIAPTVLSLLGITDAKSVMFGRDLTHRENALVVFRDGSFTDGRHYFINRFGPVSNSLCYEIGTGRQIDCVPLEGRRREALERLALSDLIIRGDLIPALRAGGNMPQPLSLQLAQMEDNMDLFIITLLVAGMGSGAVVCAYLVFKRTPRRLPDGEISLQHSRYRSLGLAGLFIFPLLAASGVGYLFRMNPYNAKEEADLAIANYSRQIELEPDFAEAYHNRGDAYRIKGEYDQAIADYSRALELKPDLVWAYQNRGDAYRIKGEYDQAIADYSRALELKPDLAWAYQNRGDAYRISGDLTSGRGDAYKAKEKYDQAIADYSRALELKPDLAEAYHGRGLLHSQRGETEKAIADFKTFTALSEASN